MLRFINSCNMSLPTQPTPAAHPQHATQRNATQRISSHTQKWATSCEPCITLCPRGPLRTSAPRPRLRRRRRRRRRRPWRSPGGGRGAQECLGSVPKTSLKGIRGVQTPGTPGMPCRGRVTRRA